MNPPPAQTAAAGHEDRWPSAAAFALAALALGHAAQISNGNLHPDAIFWLTVALALGVVGIAAPDLRWMDRLADSPAALLLAAGMAFELSELLTIPPGHYLRLSAEGYAPFFQGLALEGVVAGAALSRERWLKHLLVPVLLVTHLALGVWLIHASPAPFIDVYVFQHNATAALLHGTNPYAITFPDIYGHSLFYGPGLLQNGRLLFGFPYPPLSLFLALPGAVLGGDYRYSQLVAMAAAAGLMAYARPGRLGVLAAAAFLLTPRIFFVLEQGWTEPFAVLLLTALVFCACRFPRGVPYALGLFLAVKQYLVLAVPLSLLLLPRPWRLADAWRLWWKAGAVALLVSLPLILWDVPAFLHSAVTLQFQQPFRREALSYLAWWARDGGQPASEALSLVAALVALGLSLWRAPRTPAGFASAVALVFCAFFAFNKQAFCNYYFLVVGALCCAVAAMSGGRVSGRTPEHPSVPVTDLAHVDRCDVSAAR